MMMMTNDDGDNDGDNDDEEEGKEKQEVEGLEDENGRKSKMHRRRKKVRDGKA